jgi:hypothetical protein
MPAGEELGVPGAVGIPVDGADATLDPLELLLVELSPPQPVSTSTINAIPQPARARHIRGAFIERGGPAVANAVAAIALCQYFRDKSRIPRGNSCARLAR